MRVSRFLATCAVLVSAVPARAHHEALFGPQSASVLSPDTFLGAQVFSRRSGGPGERSQETTTVFSSGFSPTKDGRLSIAAVVPFSFITQQGRRGSQRGLEDAIISARYRVDLEGLKQKLGAFESYVVGIGGVELPTGTMDLDFMQGSAGWIGAGLMSVEIRPFSVVGYVYLHREGTVGGSGTAGAASSARARRGHRSIRSQDASSAFSLACPTRRARRSASEG